MFPGTLRGISPTNPVGIVVWADAHHPVIKAMAGFDVPLSAVKDGYNRVEVANSATEPVKIVWVEIYIVP